MGCQKAVEAAYIHQKVVFVEERNSLEAEEEYTEQQQPMD